MKMFRQRSKLKLVLHLTIFPRSSRTWKQMGILMQHENEEDPSLMYANVDITSKRAVEISEQESHYYMSMSMSPEQNVTEQPLYLEVTDRF